METMAGAGIGQFIDVGTGFPTSPNLHEVAPARQPGARVVYVDNNPVVVAHNQALRTGPGVITTIEDGVLLCDRARRVPQQGRDRGAVRRLPAAGFRPGRRFQVASPP